MQYTVSFSFSFLSEKFLSMENKKTRGRQKIVMKMVESESHRLVTFSKRRSGLYKKASELSILCGVEVVIIGFSPSGKPFAFASPCVKTVVDKFLDRTPQRSDATSRLLEPHLSSRINELIKQYNALFPQLEVENKKVETLEHTKGANHGEGWWEANIDKLSLDELEQMKSSSEDFKKHNYFHIGKLVNGTASLMFGSFIKMLNSSK